MTKAKYPNTITIGYADYKVTFVSCGLARNIDGSQHSFSQTIKISDDVTGQYRAFVMLHEILHGCFFNSALAQAVAMDKEELIVDALAKQLSGVIRDNPELMKALANDLKGAK